MTRLVAIFSLIILILAPAALLAEEFVSVECSSTYFTPLHGDSELPMVTNYKQRGVIRSKSKNNFLNNASYYLEGILTRPPSEDYTWAAMQKGEGKFAIIIMDTDGDLILGYEYGDIGLQYRDSGSSLAGAFTNGTGKYKGISGKFELTKFTGESDRIKADLKMHLEEMPQLGPRSVFYFDMCNIVKGNFEIK